MGKLYEEHGLGVHMVTNSWMNVGEARVLAEKGGWGRIHVKPVPAEGARYMGKYLTKGGATAMLEGLEVMGSVWVLEGDENQGFGIPKRVFIHPTGIG